MAGKEVRKPSDVLYYREALAYTEFSDYKFKDPEIRATLEANGAAFNDSKLALSTFPVSALIAAGLIDENGISSKRPRLPNGTKASAAKSVKQEPTGRYARLGFAETEALLTEKRAEAIELQAAREAAQERYNSANAEFTEAKLALRDNEYRTRAIARTITTLTERSEALAANYEAEIERKIREGEEAKKTLKALKSRKSS